VPGTFDHLGGQDADGAIVGGKGLIQLGHPPADAGCSLHQVDPKAHIGQVNGGLDASDASADNQNRFFLPSRLCH